MAGSIYPGQASLLDQTDSWSQRPQEMSVWQPSVEVNCTFLGFSSLTGEAFAQGTFYF